MSTVQPDELRQLFQRNMKARRQELGLSQDDVAKRAGVEQTYISDLEMGKKRPLIDSLAKLATALDTTPSALLSSVLSENLSENSLQPT
jgi:transcriptional regulator with XRE-family HTH domain